MKTKEGREIDKCALCGAELRLKGLDFAGIATIVNALCPDCGKFIKTGIVPITKEELGDE